MGFTFSHSFNKYLLNTCSVPNTVVGTEHEPVHQVELHSNGGDRKWKQTSNLCCHAAMYAMKTAKLRDEWDMVEMGRAPQGQTSHRQVWVRAARGREEQRPAALEQVQCPETERTGSRG